MQRIFRYKFPHYARLYRDIFQNKTHGEIRLLKAGSNQKANRERTEGKSRADTAPGKDSENIP